MGAAFVLFAGLALGAPAATAGDPAVLGEALYLGRTGLPASLRGDDNPLPAGAVVCAHCHEPSPRPGGARQALAPRLDARLKEAIPRRGGPASAYDEAAFCRLLNTGIDPAGILVRRVMPRFEAGAKPCAALWAFVSRREPSSAGPP